MQYIWIILNTYDFRIKTYIFIEIKLSNWTSENYLHNLKKKICKKQKYRLHGNCTWNMWITTFSSWTDSNSDFFSNNHFIKYA